METSNVELLSEFDGGEPELFFRTRPTSTIRFAELVEKEPGFSTNP